MLVVPSPGRSYSGLHALQEPKTTNPKQTPQADFLTPLGERWAFMQTVKKEASTGGQRESKYESCRGGRRVRS